MATITDGAVNVVTQAGERARLEPLGMSFRRDLLKLFAQALAANEGGRRELVRKLIGEAQEIVRGTGGRPDAA